MSDPAHAATQVATQFIPLRDELVQAHADCGLAVPYAPSRYDPGDLLCYDILGVCPRLEGVATLEVTRFVGGGFAGQVYRVRLVNLEPADTVLIPRDFGLVIGEAYALKLLRPSSRGATRFRNLLYALGYQAHFAPQVNEAAVRTLALWHKLIRRASGSILGDERSVCDTHATLFDRNLRAFGVLNEWIDGRMWKFEVDDRLFHRWKFTGETPPADHPCPEYVGKRIFMRRFVALLHQMGAGELARQYEWWTCKSQPNALKRINSDPGPGGLTAIDFASGLVLLPFLPMSLADVRLIARGVARGRFVQFDRGDLSRLREFLSAHAEHFDDLGEAIRELEARETSYRATLPDLTRRGLRVVTDRNVRASVRDGAIEAWRSLGWVDDDHAARLRTRTGTFVWSYVASWIPLCGPFLLRAWGDGVTGRHLTRCVRSPSYLGRALRGDRALVLIQWARAQRIAGTRGRVLLETPVRFTLERLLLSWLPVSWHRAITEPWWAWSVIVEKVKGTLRFLRDPAHREARLLAEVAAGRLEGMLTDREADRVISQIKDPYIQKYLRSLAVHICTLFVSEAAMVITGVVVTLYCALHRQMPWPESIGVGTGAAAATQLLPVSLGSLARGIYVLYVMIRERDIKNYYIAAPVSFIRVVGYLAFPLQMVTHNPALARFLAGRWTRRLVRMVPVFGEHGALLEHGVFDFFFNLPISLARLMRRRNARPSKTARPPASSEAS